MKDDWEIGEKDVELLKSIQHRLVYGCLVLFKFEWLLFCSVLCSNIEAKNNASHYEADYEGSCQIIIFIPGHL